VRRGELELGVQCAVVAAGLATGPDELMGREALGPCRRRISATTTWCRRQRRGKPPG